MAVSYNIFRVGGDFMHLASILILLYKMNRDKSCAGISVKTQELRLIVFLTRYVDLFWNFKSMYNSVFKVVFIASTVATLYLMKRKFEHTVDAENDNVLKRKYFLGGCAVMALIMNSGYLPFQLVWSFSLWLEAVSIIPQLFLIQRTGDVENLTSQFIFCAGGYRFLYICNWIYRLLTQTGYRNWIAWTTGIIQTALYADFFYYYFKSAREGKNLKLPEVKAK